VPENIDISKGFLMFFKKLVLANKNIFKKMHKKITRKCVSLTRLKMPCFPPSFQAVPASRLLASKTTSFMPLSAHSARNAAFAFSVTLIVLEFFFS